MSAATYNLRELPSWEPKPSENPGPNRGEKPWWSGIGSPPAIGSTVFVRMNSFGEGEVRGYYIEHGYLGLYVKPADPPSWWVRQMHDLLIEKPDWNERHPAGCCMVFGAELKEEIE